MLLLLLPDALPLAAEYGHYDVVHLLLRDSRVDPSEWDNRALRKAAANGHYRIVERLLKDPRVDPSDFDNEALKQAASKKHKEIVCLLYQNTKVVAKMKGRHSSQKRSYNTI